MLVQRMEDEGSASPARRHSGGVLELRSSAGMDMNVVSQAMAELTQEMHPGKSPAFASAFAPADNGPAQADAASFEVAASPGGASGSHREVAKLLESLRREVQEMKTQQQKQNTDIQTLQKKVWMGKKRSEAMPETECAHVQELQDVHAKMKKDIADLVRLQEKKRDCKDEKQFLRMDSEPFKELQRELSKCQADIEMLRAQHTQEIGRFVHELGELRSVQVSRAEVLERNSAAIDLQATAVANIQQQQRQQVWANDSCSLLAEIEEFKATQLQEIDALQSRQSVLADDIMRGVGKDMAKLREDLLTRIDGSLQDLHEPAFPSSPSRLDPSGGSPRVGQLRRQEALRELRSEERPTLSQQAHLVTQQQIQLTQPRSPPRDRDRDPELVQCLTLERDIRPSSHSPSKFQRIRVAM